MRPTLATNDAPIPAPRGPMLSPDAVVREFFTQPDGSAIVSAKWVRENLPGKIRLSHSKVVWYRDDVLAWLEARRATTSKSSAKPR